MDKNIEEIDLSPLVKELVSQGFTVTKIEDEPNPFDKAMDILKKHGYEVERPVQRSMKQDIDEAIKAAQAAKDRKQADNDGKPIQSLNKTNTETKTPKESIDNAVKFVLGTPKETPKEDDELTEDKIMVMTPEQIQKNMPKIRDYMLANGGRFNGD